MSDLFSLIPETRFAGMNKGPENNGGCLTILVIVGLMLLFRMCIGE